jgi:hypothetical membrane protein
MKKIFMLCGIAAAVLYVGTVILGGLLRPGYSHVSMAISELVAEGAPNRTLLSASFLVYNILVSLFGMGLVLKVNRYAHGRVTGTIGSLTLVAVGVAGILMELAFPQEPGGTATTFTGIMHFVMAGVASLGTMVAILILAFWFRSVPELKSYFAYSIISVAVVFASGGMSAAAIAYHSPFFGLVERITILTFIAWMFVIGRKIAQLEEKPQEQIHFKIARSTSKGK